ncbi:sensor histidine kinase [Flavilitoribacter nigricans DSM 23189 = NBRC 102662]|uniref:histidine kinase n=1 Tax=Flavilitoribacter nigricans (strain ATCC 23147 / DSM 23189 / NBRC 102662 / NCIMB 1420 / SS-2) TaxID=1122177 RepID=A0A2D0MZV6_FLAN2|nr:sensor histidine kinase [Flavilitoribacter nigricans DSM 23189 = NBRC 102662]
MQYVISLGLISLIAVIAHFSVSITGYKVVALILLLAVSLLAMVFDIFPVVLAAVFSALLWNFFFIPPLFKFTIATPEDALLFLMYFVIATLNAVLTSKIRKAELKAKEEEERENTIKLYNTVLNSLSHELRTPIATIIGAVDALQDNPGKLTDRDRRELYGEIGLAGTRLNRQVGNLLNMSRLESGSIQAKPDWCDLNELIFRVINMVRDKPDLREIHFDPQEDLPLFRLDQGLMEQILFNIVHNSQQYTPAGTIITIRADQYENGCRVIVLDNGPGFPESELEAVFKKFYRLPNSVTGGTGLGLSIVKGFVEAQHGTIELSNQDSGGARFDLRIPAEVSNLNEWKND